MVINISAETLGLPLQDSNILWAHFDFFIEILKKVTHIAHVVIPFWEPLVKGGKTYKITIFDSKITLMVFHTPINVARDRLDLYCDFPNEWWCKFW